MYKFHYSTIPGEISSENVKDSSVEEVSHQVEDVKSGKYFTDDAVKAPYQTESDSISEAEPISSGEIRDIKIVGLNSGYLVRVGCQSIAVETTETLLSKLNEYLTSPRDFERKWFNNSNRNKL